MKNLLCLIIIQATIMKTLVDGTLRGGCQPDQQCKSVFECARFRSRGAILRERPSPCGFSGTTPLVCCSEPTPSTTERPNVLLSLRQKLLPIVCGYPNTDLNDPGLLRRRRQTESEPLPFDIIPDDSVSDEPPPFDMYPDDDDEFGIFIQHGIGGFNAERGKWPWMVLLGKLSGDGQLGDWFCGGTLITSLYVLTAAHCVRPGQLGTIGARLGEYDLSATRQFPPQDLDIVHIKLHEGYRGAQNDIALLKLNTSVADTHFASIRPICLPAGGAEHDGWDVEMAGFGNLGFSGDLPDVLQEVPLRVMDPAACERSYRRAISFNRTFPGGFQGTKICAGSRDDEFRDACPGDSGGPLMARPTADGPYELVGVVSTGVGCGNPEFPGIYTKVSAYIEWILRNLT